VVEVACDVHAVQLLTVRIVRERLRVARRRFARARRARVAEAAVGLLAAHQCRHAEQIGDRRAVLAARQQAEPARAGRDGIAAQRLRRQAVLDEVGELGRALTGALAGIVRRHAHRDDVREFALRAVRVAQRRAEAAFACLAMTDLTLILIERGALARRVVVRTVAVTRAGHEQQRRTERPLHRAFTFATDMPV